MAVIKPFILQIPQQNKIDYVELYSLKENLSLTVSFPVFVKDDGICENGYTYIKKKKENKKILL